MMCPACGEAMAALELRGVEVDYCLNCAGVWLDDGETEWVARNAGLSPDAVTRAFAGAPDAGRGARRCPRCSGRLRRANLGGVEIDRCRSGHGLWFDRGELQSFLASRHVGAVHAVSGFLSEMFGGNRS